MRLIPVSAWWMAPWNRVRLPEALFLLLPDPSLLRPAGLSPELQQPVHKCVAVCL